MREIPQDAAPESSVSLLREGYDFIRSRCAHLRSPVFRTRLLLQDTLCLTGEDAARLFYDDSRFERTGAAPRLLRKTLFGEGGVQGLDGPAHHHRKRLFTDVLDEAGVAALAQRAREQWSGSLSAWSTQTQVVLMPHVQLLLARAVCDWAGVPLSKADSETTCDQLAAMIDGAGGIGPRHWRARRARKQAEAWAASLIAQVRDGRLAPGEERALTRVARYTTLEGELLPIEVAAVELLNLLRPTVAVSRFVVFAVLELHAQPEWRARIRQDQQAAWLFAQEVRRLYAFFPFVAARVRDDFEWQGYRFERGTRVLLDLFGTNREASRWSSPDDFQPERFEQWSGGAFDFITQGGGEPQRGHRCPGEPLAIALLVDAVRLFACDLSFSLPPQDLQAEASRMPAQPPSGLIIQVSRRGADTA